MSRPGRFRIEAIVEAPTWMLLVAIVLMTAIVISQALIQL